MKKLMILTLLLPALLLAGCTTDKPADTASAQTEVAMRAISAKDAKALMDSEDVTLIDVRTQEEYNASHIEGALLVPYDEVSQHADALPADKDKPIILYCRTGSRASAAAQTLIKLGYTQIYNMGGISDWPYGTVSGG